MALPTRYSINMVMYKNIRNRANVCSFTVILAVLLCGCSPASYVASTNQDQGIQKVYREGLELLVSQEQRSTVLAGLQRLDENEKHMQLILLVRNEGDHAFNVKPTEINVLHEQEGSSERLPIYPPDEAVDKITFDERLTAALNAAAVSYNQDTNIDTEANRDLAQSSSLEAMAQGRNVQSTLLRRETLFARNEVAGAVYFALRDSGRLTITVPINEESHTFYFVSGN